MEDGVPEWGNYLERSGSAMVDGDGDGKITADEFKAGCAKGMVKSTQP
jgi:hypothetical protein